MPNPAVAERMFQPFFSGRLWVSPRVPHGGDVRFTVPLSTERWRFTARTQSRRRIEFRVGPRIARHADAEVANARRPRSGTSQCDDG